MNKSSIVVGLVGFSVVCVACNTSGAEQSASAASKITLDVRCAQDADCAAGFECEIEIEHGVPQSFCVSHQDSTETGGALATCPPGFEAEAEQGGTFCKAHGGATSGGAGGSDDAGAGGSSASGIDDTSSSTGGGGLLDGSTCTSTSDCAAGLECEVQIENGLVSSVCKAHGGKK